MLFNNLKIINFLVILFSLKMKKLQVKNALVALTLISGVFTAFAAADEDLLMEITGYRHRQSDYAGIRNLVENKKANVNADLGGGNTPLMLVAQADYVQVGDVQTDVEIIQYLIGKGANAAATNCCWL